MAQGTRLFAQQSRGLWLVGYLAAVDEMCGTVWRASGGHMRGEALRGERLVVTLDMLGDWIV